ncbi:MAG: HAMP domain-containing protein [Deltaproteobacteria bacterium]|nr:HAMP domain-containing protein [Deltaproteobacteria bacterium]
MFRFRARFLLVHIFLVSIPIIGVVIARAYERGLLRALEDDLAHQAQVLREVILRDPSGPRLGERRRLLSGITRDTMVRIRLLDASGDVVADSQYFPSRLDQIPGARRHASIARREEIVRAFGGRYGAATRFGDTGELVREGSRLSSLSDVPTYGASRGNLFLCIAVPIKHDGYPVLGVIYVSRSTSPVWRAMHDIRNSILHVFIIALLVTALVSLFLSETIARPLNRLIRVAKGIAAGDRSQSLALDRRDEIGDLARAFAVMADRLDRRANEIAETTANLAHEFKSPLTSVRGAAELLLEGAANDKDAREKFLRNMLADASRLDRVVTRLLELARMEADVVPFEDLDLATLVTEVCATRADAGVDVRVETPLSRIRGRRAHILAALENLVDNALQNCAPDTHVTVTVSPEPAARRVAIAVHNVGTPISPANLPRIWDRFFTTRSDEGGSGLGLAVVAAVARAHGGAVHVVSTALHGTTFRLSLPATEQKILSAK